MRFEGGVAFGAERSASDAVVVCDAHCDGARGAALAGSAAAQDPGPAVREFGEEVAAGGFSVAAYVDGERCDEADLSMDRVLELGRPGQPQACGREGAAITIYSNPDGDCPVGCAAPHGEALFVRLGQTQRIDVFRPVAPDSGPSLSPPGTGSLGLTPTTGQGAAGSAPALLRAAAVAVGSRVATKQR